MIMEENIIVIRDLKTFNFNSDWPEDVDENLKLEIEIIYKCLAENKKKNEIEQFLLKYKIGNDTHECGKQQNK